MGKKDLCLFNIQRFCIHDGSGIRTTVFFKGCPLQCKWCSNPESQAMGIQAKRSSALSGKWYSLEEVLEICVADQEFFLESNGGVTLSGGEVLAQPEKAKELLYLLKKEQIHTTLETSGYAKLNIFMEVTELADMLLFDLKHYDEYKHKEGTGVSNVVILNNLKKAYSLKKDILVRIPVIPDYNNSIEDAYGFADCIKSIGELSVQLLPFHQFGQKKYEQLEISYEMEEYKSLHSEDVTGFMKVLDTQGISCFI